MTTNLFDEGDRQRLIREETLTDQAPRQPVQEDRSPDEDMEFDMMLEGMLEVLRNRFIGDSNDQRI